MRFEQLKKEDPLLIQDLVECFNQSMAQVKQALGLESLELLLNFLPNTSDGMEQQLRNTFSLLIKNQCSKQDQAQKQLGEQVTFNNSQPLQGEVLEADTALARFGQAPNFDMSQ